MVPNLLSVLVECLVADPVGEGDAGNTPRLCTRDIRVAGLRNLLTTVVHTRRQREWDFCFKAEYGAGPVPVQN